MEGACSPAVLVTTLITLLKVDTKAAKDVMPAVWIAVVKETETVRSAQMAITSTLVSA